MDKTENPNEKDREEQEDFWLTLEPLPAPDPEKPSAPVSYTHLTLPTN